MAILGFIVHTIAERGPAVEAALGSLAEVTTYGIHDDGQIVAVAEAPHEDLENLLATIREIEGVLTCYVTSLTLEDEMLPEDAPDAED